MRIKVDGVYDSRTLKLLTEIGIDHQSFDFRPTSFNFLQEHHLLEILQDHHSQLSHYYLHYEGDPDFVVEKMLTEIRALEQRGVIESVDNILLEFSDQRSASFFTQFSWQYILHYYHGMNLVDYLQSGNFSGLVLPLSILRSYYQSGTLHSFVKNFYQTLRTSGVADSFQLILLADWDSDIMPSIIDYFDFDLISLQINSKVESCYRNVSLGDLAKQCSYFSSL